VEFNDSFIFTFNILSYFVMLSATSKCEEPSNPQVQCFVYLLKNCVVSFATC